MTSKHLFFKVMKEDLRHRNWMLAFSALASFLLFPVAWLICRSGMDSGRLVSEAEKTLLKDTVYSFFAIYSIGAGGMLALCGALTAALAGFRFLFHKNQTDNWHSLPVKRNVLYGACYLNGILIWLLPLIAGMALSGSMAGSFAAKCTGEAALGEILWMVTNNVCLLTVFFLLAYNLTLVAVMLCGNVLNTLISMLIMGVGAVSIYGLGVGLCQAYLETYSPMSAGGQWAVYISPLVSAMVLLVEGSQNLKEGLDLLLINLAVAFALGVCAWLLYRKRPSELAEQGIRSRLASAVFKLVTSVAAGVGGWMFFCAITGMEAGIAWGVFGAVLTGALSFGVLDICFQMEFRAFFAHKLQMAAAVAASLFICLVFYGGLSGYDTYLPDKEDIAEIGVYESSLSNRYYSAMANPLASIKIRDKDAAYAFLERVTQWDEAWGRAMRVSVRVTLESGKTYYRSYDVSVEDKDVLWPLVTSEEYLEYSFMLGAETQEQAVVTLCRNGSESGERKLTQEERERLFAAYNQDVLENADALLTGSGRLLVRGEVDIIDENADSFQSYRMDVYDFMENTIEALRRMGYGEYLTVPEAEEIQYVKLFLNRYADKNATAEELINAAGEYYGVYEEVQETKDIRDLSVAGETAAVGYAETQDVSAETAVLITDRAEIEELLSVLSYAYNYRGDNIFSPDFIFAEMTGTDGEAIECYVRRGDLPVKYIYRFGQLSGGSK